MALRHVQVYSKETEGGSSDCRCYPTFNDSDDNVFEEPSDSLRNYCALDFDDSDDEVETLQCSGRYAPLQMDDVGRLIDDEFPTECTENSQQIHIQVMNCFIVKLRMNGDLNSWY